MKNTSKAKSLSPKTVTEVKVFTGISKFWFDLKEDGMKPKYNYLTGMLSGIIVSKISMIQGIVEGSNGKPAKSDEKIIQMLLSDILDGSKQLVEKYHWNRLDLNNLAMEFFGND